MDNTWAAGLAFKPLAHGVDVSVQALTKYVGGHSDLMMGVDLRQRSGRSARPIAETIEDLGWRVSPDDAWLALRGLRTLPLRYAEQARSAHDGRRTGWRSGPRSSRVLHPALPGDPGHAIWARDFTGRRRCSGW